MLIFLAACAPTAETGDPTKTEGNDSGRDSVDTETTVTVPNAAPSVTSLWIERNVDAQGAETLRCVATAEDPEGAEVSLAYAWSVDGVASVTGADVDGAEAARGQRWRCAVTPSDGEVEGVSVATEIDATAGPPPSQYVWEKVMDLSPPADIDPLPDGQLLITGMDGMLRRVDPATGTTTGEVMLYDHYDDLLAVALSPDFGDGVDDYVYAWGNTTCTLKRFPLDLTSFTVGAEETLISFDCGGGDGHCGGDLMFWDGEGETALYVVTGPAADGDPQDTSNLGNGKLLALHVDETTGEVTGAFDFGQDDTRVAANGMRNPWRLADCGAALCIADPGGHLYEEVNLYTRAGQNFGFPYFEGPGDGSYDEPYVYWDREDTTNVFDDRTGGAEIGFVHAPTVGPRMSDRGYGGRLAGWSLYTDVYDGWVRAHEINDDGSAGAGDVDIAHLQFVLDFAEAPDGTMYAADMGGALWRLTLWADRPRVGEAGEALSDTVYGEARGFDVTWPLWSNGADKERRVWLPPETQIDTSVADAWVWPEGARLYKTFSWAGTPIETRVIELRDGAWIPGVYQWEGDDAYLTDGGRIDLTLADGSPYQIPGSSSCFECHEATRGRDWPLGFTPLQLQDTQLTSFADLFSVHPGPAPLPEGDSVTQFARGYLHANCAFCHNAEGLTARTTVLQFDLRYDADLSTITEQVAQYYEANPNLDNGAPICDPVNPANSAIIQVLSTGEMPYIGVWAPDTESIARLETWIATLDD